MLRWKVHEPGELGVFALHKGTSQSPKIQKKAVRDKTKKIKMGSGPEDGRKGQV